MRCDVNVSVRPVGREAFGTKVEVKNMNSFSGMQKAIDFEIQRQVRIPWWRRGFTTYSSDAQDPNALTRPAWAGACGMGRCPSASLGFAGFSSNHRPVERPGPHTHTTGPLPARRWR